MSIIFGCYFHATFCNKVLKFHGQVTHPPEARSFHISVSNKVASWDLWELKLAKQNTCGSINGIVHTYLWLVSSYIFITRL